METDIGTIEATDGSVMASELAHSRSTVEFAFKTAMLGAVAVSALSFLTNAAHAACDTATITGSCQNLELPSIAGNTDYTIAPGATVSSSSGGNSAIRINGEIKSLTIDGDIDDQFSEGSAISLAQDVSISGGIVNNSRNVVVSSTFIETGGGNTLGGGFLNTGDITFSTDVDSFNPLFQITGYSNRNFYNAIDTINGGFKNLGNLVSSLGTVLYMDGGSTINGGFANSGTIRGDKWAIFIQQDVAINGGFVNKGTIEGGAFGANNPNAHGGIYLAVSTIDTVTNVGSIFDGSGSQTSLQGFGILVDNYGGGDFCGSDYDQPCRTKIGTLNNLQGVGNTHGALTYRGVLPDYYNMIAYGDQYGQLAVQNAVPPAQGYADPNTTDGSFTFGIFGGDAENGIAPTQLKTQTYFNVMTGVEVSDIENAWAQATAGDHRTFGTHDGMIWMLRENIANDSWNLETFDFVEPTVSSLSQLSGELRGMANLSYGLSLGCDVAKGHRGCVAVKGGSRAFASGGTETLGALSGSYWLDDEWKVGGFVEFNLGFGSDYHRVVGQGSAYGASLSFVQSQDGIGLKGSVGAALGEAEVDLSREALLGNGLRVGGQTSAKGFAIAGSLAYGFAIGEASKVIPFFGAAMSRVTREGYSEVSDSGSEAFSYDSFSQRYSTLNLGASAEHDLQNGWTLLAGLIASRALSVETDTFTASSDVVGLEQIGLESTSQVSSMGISANIGATYAISDSEHLSFEYEVSRPIGGDRNDQKVMLGLTLSFDHNG